jgi:hypothetical protein
MIGLARSLPHSNLIGDGDFVILDEYNAFADFKTIAAMSEDSAAEVRHSLPLLGMLNFKRADHAAMGEYKYVSPLVPGMDAVKGSAGAHEQFVMEFVARWPLVVAQVARPLRFDFCPREAFPFAGIAFHEVGVNDDRAHTNLRTDDLCGFERTNERRGNDEVDRANALCRMECLLPAKVGEGGVGFALPSTNGIPF